MYVIINIPISFENHSYYVIFLCNYVVLMCETKGV